MFSRRVNQSSGLVIFLTGAGISAESGIPTFRGSDGYWSSGSKNYRPQELGTFNAFSEIPEVVWEWYLHRRRICRAAEPNSAHLQLAKLEEQLGNRFLLVTQNVDGLHLRAGNSAERTYEIHGSIDYFRCSKECTPQRYLIEEDAIPTCPACGAMGRPNLLWFDECYDEEHYRYHSSRAAALKASVMVSVGTSGVTNLPTQMGEIAKKAGALLIDINPESNPFSRLAQGSGGQWLRGPASTGMARLYDSMQPSPG